MTRRLYTEDEIWAAGAENARRARDAGWRMPDHVVDRIVEILAPVRHLLDPPRDDGAAA